MLIGFIAMSVASWVGLYGASKYYEKDKGEALEKEVVKVENKAESNHSLLLLEQKHTNAQLGELKEMIKEYYRERRSN